jgi:glycerol 3-phosphatase-1
MIPTYLLILTFSSYENIDVRKIEGLIPQRFGSEAVEIPGSRTVLSQLGPTPWAIVTSGTQPLVSGWLDIMKLTRPAVLVTAEDVLNGKPDPACYALAREKLGLDSNARVLVVEDAPAGIKAGKGAGCEVLGLVTSHNVNEVNIGEANWIIKDLRSLKILGWDDEKKVVRVEISHALVNRSN